MTFLYVSGSDYAALDFEQTQRPQKIYEEMMEGGKTEIVIKDYTVKIVKLNIDMDALCFIKDNLCDYDMLKDSNIIEVEEE